MKYVDEDGNLQARLFVCCCNDGIKAVGKLGGRIGSDGILLFVESKSQIQVRTQGFCIGASTAHVESNHGICLPILLQIHDFESFEEFLSSFEVTLERINEHRLSESARTAQVIILFAFVRQIPNDVSLINIEIVFFSYLVERLYACR